MMKNQLCAGAVAMREYGQIQSSFWQSPDARAYSDRAKLLALYLLSGPHANGIGCYRLPNGYVMADLGWSDETASKAFDELSSNGFAYRFEGVVFIPKFLRWNKIANANIAKARFGDFESLPKGEAKTQVARAMLAWCNWWEAEHQTVLETVAETLSEGNANQNPIPPNPIQRTPHVAQRAARRTPSYSMPFEQFWSAYPRKMGKQDALKVFEKLAPDSTLLDLMLVALRAQSQLDQWQREGGKYIPHAATWLRGRRWEDEVSAAVGTEAHATSGEIALLRRSL
jgi:hypothetical protein